MFFDFVSCLWIWIVFLVLFLWLPKRLFPALESRSFFLHTPALGIRYLLLTIAGVGLLETLHILNAITVALYYLACWVLMRARSSAFSIYRWQKDLLKLICKAERLLSRIAGPIQIFVHREWSIPSRTGRLRNQNADWKNLLLAVSLALVVLITFALRLDIPLHQVRYPDDHSYEVLLRTRELMLNLQPWKSPFVTPVLCAVVSLFSAVNSMEVVRFLAPLFGIGVVASAGIAVACCCRSNWGGVFASYVLGSFTLLSPAANFSRQDPATLARQFGDALRTSLGQQVAASDPQIGSALLLLAAAFLADCRYRRSRASLVDACLCLVAVTLCAPMLLLPGAIALLTLFVSPTLFLLVLSVSWALIASGPILLGDLPSSSQQVGLATALAVALGVIVSMLERSARKIAPAKSAFVEGVILLAVMYFLTPHRPYADFVEYDAAARETLAIEQRLPRGTWEVVAPVEQFSEAYGFGQYEDLQDFVVRNGPSAEEQARGPVFVFVETTPFRKFATEPLKVNFSTLVDPTYRNYRSPAGRATLETAALRICEEYRMAHPSSSVFYDDGALRIYKLRNR